MKELKINEKCNQCGICVLKCPAYFSEDSDGDINVVSSTVNETDELKAAVESCPVKAIELGAEIDSKEKIQEYVNQLSAFMSGITVTREDIAFNEAYTRNVYVPSAGMSGYSYKSSSQAERAGYDAFVSRSYSQIDKLILERITDYRVTEIKPYYTTDSNSVYWKNNQKIVDVLKAISIVIGADKLPSDFCTVEVYPDTRDTAWKMLNRGELIGDNYIGMVKREFNYSASDYKTYIDWDDMEDYRGKDIYNYNANDASRELGSDLAGALRYARSDIEDATLGYIRGIVNSYNDNLKACLEKKLMEVKKNSQFSQISVSVNNSSASSGSRYVPSAISSAPHFVKVKLKPSAKYYVQDFEAEQNTAHYPGRNITKEYLEMKWKYNPNEKTKCNCARLTPYNSNLITIFVNPEYLVEI